MSDASSQPPLIFRDFGHGDSLSRLAQACASHRCRSMLASPGSSVGAGQATQKRAGTEPYTRACRACLLDSARET